jgi:hypothetical protein
MQLVQIHHVHTNWDDLLKIYYVMEIINSHLTIYLHVKLYARIVDPV